MTGAPDKVFVMATAEWVPGAATGRHTHPGDEYGTVVDGTVMTRQGEGEWRTVEAGQNYYVPAGIIHETKNADRQAGANLQRLDRRKGQAARDAGTLRPRRGASRATHDCHRPA